MPAVGTRTNPADLTRGYQKDPLHKLAEEFVDIAKSALTESGISLYESPSMFFQKNATNDEMKNFFIRETYDPKDPRFQDPEEIAAFESDLGELYTNNRQAVMESAPLGSFNPVIGISFPMAKNILMNAVFDQAMPKDIARAPKFTLTMETRTLVTPDGQEIDMFLEQYKIKDAIKNSVPTQDIIVNLPENESINVLSSNFGITGPTANLSIKTCITGVIANSYVVPGGSYWSTSTNSVAVLATGAAAGIMPVLFPTPELKFVPSYGEFDRSIMASFSITVATAPVGAGAPGVQVVTGVLTGYMKKNMFMLACPNALQVTAVMLHAVVDVSSAAFETCHTKWSARTDIFEVPEAPHITTTISPEEVKDITALYNVNQITKLMSMMRLALVQWKDDSIHDELDNSFMTMPAPMKVSGAFDFVPPQGSFMGSHVAWRHETFMDYLDMQVTYLLQVLNDENMTVTIFGRPELIRKITPTQYTYQTPSNIGPIELDYKRTIVTSDKRIYQFISSQKLRNNNNLIILLCPRNTNRIVYKVVDYQLYVSNEIRDTSNYQLPAITCFERWMFLQYQPIQGRIQIMNPTGLREDIQNPDPIGVNALNDYTSNGITYVSPVNNINGKDWPNAAAPVYTDPSTETAAAQSITNSGATVPEGDGADVGVN